MLLGPVLPVELITSARRVRYFVVRVAYAVLMLLTLWARYEATMSWRIRDSGQSIDLTLLAEFANKFFEHFALMQVLAVLLLTPPIVAGTIAEEKDRRTLDHLLVTDLRDWEIVYGKLMARMLNLIALIAVGWPILAMLMLLGGVAMENILAMFAITASTAIAVGGLSIWASVQARRGHDAVIRVFVIGLALLLLPLIVDSFGWVASWEFADWLVKQLRASDPVSCLGDAITQSGTDWGPVGQLVRNHLILAIPCLLLALWRIRPVYLRQIAGGKVRRSLRVWRPNLGGQVMLWKELFAERPGFALGLVGTIAQVLLVICAIGPAVWMFWDKVTSGRRGAFIDELLFYICYVGTGAGCIGLLMVAVRAAGSITRERERQTWDVLLSTPLESAQIVLGKIAGSFYAMRWMILVHLVLCLLGVLAGSIPILVLLCILLEIVIFGVFAATVGVLFSMKQQTSLRSMAATLATLIFVGGGYLMCCIPVLESAGDGAEILLAGCVPFLLALPLLFEETVRHESALIGVFAIGIFCYLVLGLMLSGIAVGSFDELTGRGWPRGVIPRRPRERAGESDPTNHSAKTAS